MKVELLKEKTPSWIAPGTVLKTVKRCLPYWKSSRGFYVHRVRSAINHWHKGKFSHTSYHMWCGYLGHIDKNRKRQNKLMGIVPEDDVICATCEGRAIGAGQDESRIINGRSVLFSPRMSC